MTWPVLSKISEAGFKRMFWSTKWAVWHSRTQSNILVLHVSLCFHFTCRNIKSQNSEIPYITVEVKVHSRPFPWNSYASAWFAKLYLFFGLWDFHMFVFLFKLNDSLTFHIPDIYRNHRLSDFQNVMLPIHTVDCLSSAVGIRRWVENSTSKHY